MLLLLSLLALSCWPAVAQQTAGAPDKESNADAYYHFSMAHLYRQMAMQFNRQEYVDKAFEEYRAAIKADPETDYLRMQLVELYAATNRLDDAVKESNVIIERSPRNIEVRKLLGQIYSRFATDRRGGIDISLLKSAVEQYEKILEISPDEKESLLQISNLYRASQQPDKAEKALKRVLELEPESSEALAQLAYLYIEMGDPKAASEALEKVRSSGRAERGELLALATAYERNGENEKAVEIYRELLETPGNTLQIRRSLAHNLIMAGKLEEALGEYQKLVETEPQNPENHLRVSQIYSDRKDFDKAWASLRKAMEIDPDSTEIKYSAVMLLATEGRGDEAVEAMKKLIELTDKENYTPREVQNRAMFFEQLGSMLRGQDRFDEAREAFLKMAESHPDSRPLALMHVVETYRYERNYSRALSESAKYVDEFPESRSLALLRATVLAETGDADAAAKLLKKHLRNNAGDREIYLRLSEVYQKSRKFDDAIAAISKAQDLAASEPDRLNVLFAHGSVLERAKRFEEAEGKFREVLQADPNNSSALNYLGYMLADLDVRLDEAHDMIQRALDMEPENGAYLDSLGWLYYRQDKLELAERYLQRSLKQFSRDATVLSHLADVYHKQGNLEKAVDYWKRSLEEWQKNPAADQDRVEMEKLKKKLSESKLPLSSQANQSDKKSTDKKR